MAVGDDILAMMRAVEEQVPYKRTDCPVCAWPLHELEDGSLHCEFCGWTDILGESRE